MGLGREHTYTYDTPYGLLPENTTADQSQQYGQGLNNLHRPSYVAICRKHNTDIMSDYLANPSTPFTSSPLGYGDGLSNPSLCNNSFPASCTYRDDPPEIDSGTTAWTAQSSIDLTADLGNRQGRLE